MFNEWYYQVRPFIPRRIQIFVRAKILRRKYEHHGASWPICEQLLKGRQEWPGWPDAKRFAFVSTHDVETEEGQARCERLMWLEQTLGFVSSFNFVPERYRVSEKIRDLLTGNGFEVGVHDLKHDGKLFRSRSGFHERAKSINGYLKEWGAVGFRAGAMHHNLEWIHALDVEYDASTFDYDPFEPQPDGVGTIFPFWVNLDSARDGYVELPYTLPQDFTLFVLLKEKSIDIWKKKLDWVASRGGMCLVITHPDYMNFDDRPNRFDEYPVRYYTDLLQYLKDHYTCQYWNATPRDIASYFRQTCVPE